MELKSLKSKGSRRPKEAQKNELEILRPSQCVVWRRYLLRLHKVGDGWIHESGAAVRITGEKRSTRRETCPSATLSTTNPTCSDLEWNHDLRGERPTTNCPCHGTVHDNYYEQVEADWSSFFEIISASLTWKCFGRNCVLPWQCKLVHNDMVSHSYCMFCAIRS
jgi:hypothetical protein